MKKKKKVPETLGEVAAAQPDTAFVLGEKAFDKLIKKEEWQCATLQSLLLQLELAYVKQFDPMEVCLEFFLPDLPPGIADCVDGGEFAAGFFARAREAWYGQLRNPLSKVRRKPEKYDHAQMQNMKSSITFVVPRLRP